MVSLQSVISRETLELRMREGQYIKATPPVNKLDSLSKRSPLLLISVAFNKPDLIDLQLRLLRKNCLDDYSMLICDNSNDNRRAMDIQAVCKNHKTAYIKLPSTIHPEHPSKSHGAAINWAHRNVVKKYKPKVFGLLDHDIFLIKKASILERMKSFPLYGVREQKGDKWYLWPGFSFYSTKFTKFKKMDFLPAEGLDTGGSNWYKMYKKTDPSKLLFASRKTISINQGNNKQRDKIQLIDKAWTHLINGSNWANEDMTKKTSWLDELATKA